MSTLTCIDLDRTVIYSPTAMQLEMADVDAPRLLCVEVYRGAPLSFVTERAGELLTALSRSTTLVPTTTRTPEQLARVHLPLSPAPTAEPQYAIASNGGHLLVDGRADGDWAREVTLRLRGCAPVAEVHEHLLRSAGEEYVHSLRIASDLFVYAVVERAALPEGWTVELAEFCDARGWGVSLQGRKVYCVPRPLTKSAAVAEIARRIGGAPTVLAAGDSLLDAEMLQHAHLAVRPAAGELADTGFTAGHVHCLSTPGIVGGEHLLEWLLEQVRGATAGSDSAR